MVGLFQNNMMLRRRNMMAEDSKIVIADDTKYGVAEANAPVVEIMYKKGWCKNEHYVTQGECNAITPSMIGDAFQNTTAIEHFDELKYFGSLNVLPGSMFYACTELKRVTIPSGCKALNSGIFRQCYALETVNTQGNDFHATTTLSWLFYDCSSLTTLDTSGWDTSKVINMGNMFWLCKSLTTLDVSGWNTENVTSIRGQFGGCRKLEELDMGTWDTSKVTSFYSYPFNNLAQCYSLRKLNIKNWDTTNFNEFQLVVYSEMEELILGEGCGKCKNTMSIDTSMSTKWVGPSLTTSLLALYDRKTNGLSDCTIKLSSQSYAALGDDNIATLQARGYNVTT